MPAKKLTADFLFFLQIVLAIISGGSEFLRLLTSSQGINLSWLASWVAFLWMNLALTIRAHRALPSRVTLQTVLTYVAWTTVISADLAVMVWKGRELWDLKDTVTVGCEVLGIVAICLWARRRRLGLTDPIVNGLFAVCFIGIPQVTLAYKIFTAGGEGMAGAMLAAGHIGIVARLGQLGFAIREAGWDRNRKGAALSEIANEVTWVLVTAAWLWD